MAGPRTAARRVQALLAAVVLLTATPASATAAEPGHPNPVVSYVTLTVPGTVVPLINSGEIFDGVTFEGIPDGIGIVPVGGRGGRGGHDDDDDGPDNNRRSRARYVDVYVNFEQSHVPFDPDGAGPQPAFADFEDSSVHRARLNLDTKKIVELEEVLPPSAGFIRFCSAFMAGPEHGFKNYTFLLGEESDDVLSIPAGAPYGADPAFAPNLYRQAGYSVYLDTETGQYDEIAGLGRINHENNVVVPGRWRNLAILTSDDTFTAPSSQLYLYLAKNDRDVRRDRGTLWAFRVTATHNGPVAPANPLNDANDYLEISLGQTWKGEFIPVPSEYARGTTGERPQAALERWSNDNNVFQFVRVEDMAYDPDSPRTVYFTDTGTTRLSEVQTVNDPRRGRLERLPLGNTTGTDSDGRVFEIVFNRRDPTKVDSFRILADTQLGGAAAVGFRQPDNLDVGKNSIMLQEDSANNAANPNAKIWRYDMTAGTWAPVAIVDHPTGPAVDPGESSGIVDVSKWLGAGWWALDVQSHVNRELGQAGQSYQPLPSGTPITYQTRREDGQLLLMHIPGS